jgi:hypothetical protein
MSQSKAAKATLRAKSGIPQLEVKRALLLSHLLPVASCSLL